MSVGKHSVSPMSSHALALNDTAALSMRSGGSQAGSQYNMQISSSPAVESPQQHNVFAGQSQLYTSSYSGFHKGQPQPLLNMTQNTPNRPKESTADRSRHSNTPPIREDPRNASAHSAGSANKALHSPVSQNEEQATSKSKDDTSAQNPPAWTEMKTKAGKDRKRLPLACIACRRKKIRCSGEHPACKHCIRSRIPCVYKVTTRKAAPRTDYMAMLDKRLKRMEERVIKVIPKEQQSIVASTGRATVRPTATPQLRRLSTSKKRAAEQSIADLEDWAKSDEQRSGSGRSMYANHDVKRTHELEEQSLLKEGIDRLPPKDLQHHLVEVFFDYVYGQSYHLLHKPSFMRKLAHDQIAPVLMLAVCAMAARFSDHPAVRTEPAFLRGEEWAAAAREISLKRYDSPNITILIVYLILTLHEFGTCQGGRSWMFGGMAQRMAYALQLHQDLLHEPKSSQGGNKIKFSFTDREIRRRTMWACFLMDRFCSSGTDRPTFVSTDHIKAQLPVAEHLFTRELVARTEDLSGDVSTDDTAFVDQMSDPKENMGVAAYTIRIIAIWGEAITYYNLGGKQREKWLAWDERSDFYKLKQKLKVWDEMLPDRLRYNADNRATHVTEKIANQFIFMHIIFHQTILFVNHFALPNPGTKSSDTKQMPAKFLRECAESAFNAANRVSLLVKDGMNHNVVAPFAGYAAFFSAAVHIQGTFSRNETLQLSSKRHLTWNINYLTKMKKYWGMFHFMTENLRDLYRKHADMTRTNTPRANVDSTADNEGIFQYGDWFHHYPHGVSGLGFDKQHIELKQEPGADAGLAQRSDLHTVEEFFANLSPSDQPLPSAKAKRQHKRQPSRNNCMDTSETSVQQSAPSIHTQHSLPTQMPLHQSQAPMYDQNLTPTSYGSGFQEDMSAVFREVQDLGSLSYMNQHNAMDPMNGYQTELAQLVNESVDPLMGNMNMGFGAAGIPNMPLGQGPYDNATPGVWFMPYNLDPPAIAQATSAFNGGNAGWPSGQLQDLQPTQNMSLRSPMDMEGSQ